MIENTNKELGLGTRKEVLANMNLQDHKKHEMLILEKSEKRTRNSFEVEHIRICC